MNQLFSTQNYRDFLREIAYSTSTKRGFQAQLARAMGCQAAYLSQVLKGSSELTEDQAFKAAQFLGLSRLGVEYFVLLVRQARSSTPQLREHLEVRRLEIVKETSEVQSRLNSENSKLEQTQLIRYFSSALPSTIHIATSSEKYRTPELLAQRFGLSISRVKEILQFLGDIGLIAEKNRQWHYQNAPLHFPRESPLNVSHQLSRRRQAMTAIEENDPANLHFSSVFTADSETFDDIKSELLSYIEKSHAKVHASGTSEVYSMSLDLFRA
jgi:uncharacterized protein (TIGR02147 family)